MSSGRNLKQNNKSNLSEQSMKNQIHKRTNNKHSYDSFFEYLLIVITSMLRIMSEIVIEIMTVFRYRHLYFLQMLPFTVFDKSRTQGDSGSSTLNCKEVSPN